MPQNKLDLRRYAAHIRRLGEPTVKDVAMGALRESARKEAEMERRGPLLATISQTLNPLGGEERYSDPKGFAAEAVSRAVDPAYLASELGARALGMSPEQAATAAMVGGFFLPDPKDLQRVSSELHTFKNAQQLHNYLDLLPRFKNTDELNAFLTKSEAVKPEDIFQPLTEAGRAEQFAVSGRMRGTKNPQAAMDRLAEGAKAVETSPKWVAITDRAPTARGMPGIFLQHPDYGHVEALLEPRTGKLMVMNINGDGAKLHQQLEKVAEVGGFGVVRGRGSLLPAGERSAAYSVSQGQAVPIKQKGGHFEEIPLTRDENKHIAAAQKSRDFSTLTEREQELAGEIFNTGGQTTDKATLSTHTKQGMDRLLDAILENIKPYTPDPGYAEGGRVGYKEIAEQAREKFGGTYNALNNVLVARGEREGKADPLFKDVDPNTMAQVDRYLHMGTSTEAVGSRLGPGIGAIVGAGDAAANTLYDAAKSTGILPAAAKALSYVPGFEPLAEIATPNEKTSAPNFVGNVGATWSGVLDAIDRVAGYEEGGTVKEPMGPPYIDSIINYEARNNDLPPHILRAMIQMESRGNPKALRYESNVDDYSYGLMQVRAETAQEQGYTGAPEGLFDPRVNIAIGAKYLKKQLDRYGGDINKAIAAYNAGHARPRGQKFINQRYVDKVLEAAKEFE